MISIPGYAIQEKMRQNWTIDTYHALRLIDKRKVLLKVPNNHYSVSDNLAILQHEYRLLNGIQNSAIIKSYDFLQSSPGPALILEGIDGQLLSSYLIANRLELNDFFILALQLVDIVGELHQRNIIHNEIKPANFIINTKKPSLKLVDMSASTNLNEEAFDYASLSKYGDGLAYISPEQTGRINRPVDYRTDYYSLGIALYEMLTNQVPFETSDTLELVHCHIAKKPPSVLEIRPNVPKMMAAIIDKLLEKMPEERYSSIIGLKSDIQECYNQWLSNNNSTNYILGSNEIRDHLNISHNLYGREKQVKQLLDAYSRVSHSTKEIVLVAGYSGVGKTSLVKEVHKPIVQNRGYFIQGKFDLLQRGEPYSAIVAAFQNLVSQVLSESDTQLEAFAKHLLQTLGKLGQVIIDVIPEVELIIGPQPPVHQLNPTESQIRFNMVFQNFVHVFARAEHPLVVFLDDLQWADNASLNFIENLLQDNETKYLLIIGAYRDNEVNINHPLQLSINKLIQQDVTVTNLILGPLSLNNVQQLLQDTLLGQPEKIQNLAQCIFDKTQGNPFFISEFLKILYQKKLLAFSYEHGAWEWDISKIQQQSATDNVIHLLTSKINLLDKPTQEILKLGSCFGHQFDFESLLIINNQTISDTARQLSDAMKANLIYALEEPYKTIGLLGLNEGAEGFNLDMLRYRFAHDKIQQAVYELIVAKERPALHLKIGRLLLTNKPLEEHDERLFIVLKHFSQCASLIHDIDEKFLLAKYYYWAGKKAKLSSAYDAANEYLSQGVSLLEPINWKQHYDLVFPMYREFAVCKYLSGDYDDAIRCFSQLLKLSHSAVDSLEIYRLKIEMLSTLGKHTEALKIGLVALSKFKVKLSENPNMLHILSAIYKIKFKLRNIHVDSINLPPMEDLQQKAIAGLVNQLLNCAFIANQKLFVLLTCKNVSLSLKYGYTESAALSIPAYAFIIMHSLDLYDDALSFVRLYDRLKQKYGASDFEGKNQFTICTLIDPYHTSIAACNNKIVESFKMCCDVGDLSYCNYCGLLLVIHSLSAGKGIGDVKKNIQFALSVMSKFKITDFLSIVKFWDYSTQCLERDELIDEKQFAFFEDSILNIKNKTEVCFFYSGLIRLQFLLGEFEGAVASGQKYEEFSEYDKGFISQLDGKLFYALALFCYLPKLPKTKQNLHFKKLKELSRFIDKYATWCPTNFKAYSLLIAAEYARLDKSYESAFVLYDQAIETALETGLVLIGAIACERVGSCYLENKIERVAKLYLQNAHRYFKEWGVLTKIKLLEQTYPEFALGASSSNYNAILDSIPNPQASTKNLDMLTILKSTQLISSEIRLDKLLQNLLVIVLENAGAQRSVILAKRNEQWMVEAEGNLEKQVIYLNELQEKETTSNYPLSILNYVQRTQKPIILNDAIESELALQDVYVQQENPRSLLMMPLFYQGQLCRMLYLENNSNSYAFTPNHLDSLQMLASQAMISLENAKLYYQATHDPLTGLANRNLLYEIFHHTVAQISRSQGRLAILLLDLDYFKSVNDALGHDIGDKVLTHVAKTLAVILREGDLAVRMGGDEFIIMLANVTSTTHLTAIIERLLTEISKPFHIDKHMLQISASMGISIYPKDGNDIQTLLKLADTALYQAKAKGRNQFHYYSIELHEEYNRIYGLGKELQRAYEKQEFFLVYQPIHSTDGAVIGMEALLRWNHPERGILEANDFIHVLEKSSLIIPVSEWIINKACQQAKEWQIKKILLGPISVNVSAVQFIRHSISKILKSALAKTRLKASWIELEITETVFIEFNEKLYKEIDLLKEMGIHLVIDDFGTGYSSLSYIEHLPVSKIKIDKIFISNHFNLPIISAVTLMAHQLGIKVVAEGVETETQLKLLEKQKVDGIQGYYFSRPLTVEHCELYFQDNLKNMKK